MRPRHRKMLGLNRASIYKLEPGDGSAAHQLVGRVMAYQGEDG
jgi:hypothetical protein